MPLTVLLEVLNSASIQPNTDLQGYQNLAHSPSLFLCDHYRYHICNYHVIEVLAEVSALLNTLTVALELNGCPVL